MNPPGAAQSLLPSLPRGARLLILRLRSIGDIVLLTPALRLLKQWRPDLRTSVLIEGRFQDLLGSNPDIEEVILIDNARGAQKLRSQWRTIRALRSRKFSLCLNLHGGPTSAVLTAAAGARWRAGCQHFRHRRLYNVLVPDARTILHQSGVHTAEHQASALFWMGLPRTSIPAARLEVGEEDQRWWAARRDRLALPPASSYAVIHPTALYATKQWAPEHFARLGSYLEQAAGLKVVFSAGPGESAVLDAVAGSMAIPMRRLERATLGQFAAALSEARLFVGNDSGPAHMAVALRRPSVVIFGSSNSRIWKPWKGNETGHVTQVVQNDYDCNPCPGDCCYRYERPECILSVTFEQVQTAVEAVLSRSGKQGVC